MEWGTVDANTIILVVGWIVGGLIVIAGMRGQVSHLANEVKLLREALQLFNTRIGKNEADIAYLRGRHDEREENYK